MSEENKNNKKLYLWEKIFIKMNILIIILITFFYAYRTVYYYRKMNVIKDNITLKEKLLKEVVYQDDGLYEDNNYYYFKGSDIDNYILFQGRLFRIISVDKGIKVIEDNNNTNLIWSINTNFNDSLINKWLNNYLNTFKDYDKYLIKTDWCNSNVDINNYQCNETINSYIGLLNTKEYLQAGGKNSYLNNEAYYWTINYDNNNQVYFINNEGSINNIINQDNNYFSYGVRPVLVLKNDLVIVSGDGTIDTPYIIDNNEHTLLKDSYIGEYVEYLGKGYRIIDNHDGTTLMSVDLYDEIKYSDLAKTETNLLKDFNKGELVKVDYCLSTYNFDNKYDYLCTNNTSNYITIPKVGDIFISDTNNYWLNTIQNKNLNLYYAIDNNLYYGDLTSNKHGIKIIIKLKDDIVINSGNGTSDSPYVIGDSNEEENALTD